jgi:hypothetical protein
VVALPAALGAAAGLALAQPGAPSPPRLPAPRIHRHPLPRTRGETARFTFTDAHVGTSFLCSLDGRTYRRCSSSQIFRHLRVGAHRFRVEAKDGDGRTSRPAAYGWRVDAGVLRVSISPTSPTIVLAPSHLTSATTATFTFTDSAAGVAFLCTRDARPPASCRSPITYGQLSAGAHTFRVSARYGVGRESQPATYRWTVEDSGGGPLTVTGRARGPLLPGTGPEPIAVRLANPASTRLSITSLTVTVDGSRLPAGCAPGNFELTQSDISTARPVTVSGNGAVTLPAQGATAPAIAMIDTKSDQDGCRGATLTLDYAESTHQ